MLHSTAMRGAEKQCNCGVHYLGTAGGNPRISHRLLLLLGHRYIQIAMRSGHNEYVCIQCGHPLLFKVGPGSLLE